MLAMLSLCCLAWNRNFNKSPFCQNKNILRAISHIGHIGTCCFITLQPFQSALGISLENGNRKFDSNCIIHGADAFNSYSSSGVNMQQNTNMHNNDIVFKSIDITLPEAKYLGTNTDEKVDQNSISAIDVSKYISKSKLTKK